MEWEGVFYCRVPKGFQDINFSGVFIFILIDSNISYWVNPYDRSVLEGDPDVTVTRIFVLALTLILFTVIDPESQYRH